MQLTGLLVQIQPMVLKYRRLKEQLQRLLLLQRNLKQDRAGESSEVDNCQGAVTEVVRQAPSGTPESISHRGQSTDHFIT